MKRVRAKKNAENPTKFTNYWSHDKSKTMVLFDQFPLLTGVISGRVW